MPLKCCFPRFSIEFSVKNNQYQIELLLLEALQGSGAAAEPSGDEQDGEGAASKIQRNHIVLGFYTTLKSSFFQHLIFLFFLPT